MVDVPVDAHMTAGKTGKCPICRRPSDSVLRPFCSKRCADVDLHRWLAGTYAIPADKDVDQEAAIEEIGGSEI